MKITVAFLMCLICIQLFACNKNNEIKQTNNSAAQPIKKGDVVNIPENTEHWHGASATNKMVHIAITNYKDDVQVTWLQPVSDEEYNEVNKK